MTSISIIESRDDNNKILEVTETSQDKTVRSNLHSDFIKGRPVHFLIPQESGTGVSAAYIEALNTIDKNETSISFIGYNLTPANDKAFFDSIKTIEFKG